MGLFSRIADFFRRKPAPAAPRPRAERPPMHWRPGGVGNPVCGAREWSLWTVESRWATCPGCLSLVFGVELRQHTNTR